MTKTILFACTMNSVRSPIAAALYSHCLPNDTVLSAGIIHGKPDFFIKRILLKKGIDVSRHVSQTYQELKINNFDNIFTLSESAYRKAMSIYAFNNSIITHWSITEPNVFGGSESQTLASYENILNEILIQLELFFPDIKNELSKLKALSD